MTDLEIAILESFHALGGHAKLQDVYSRILRNHASKLQRLGEITRKKKGVYGLTEKGLRRIGIEKSDAKPLPPPIEYWVDDEFGGVITIKPREAQPSHKPSSGGKKYSPTRTVTRIIRKKTTCPVCKVSVRADRLEKHKRKVHPNWAGSHATLHPISKSSSTETLVEYPEESLHQSDHEALYGDKYVGQTRRDYDGTFGSIPLYDDFGDESGPD